jgi:hypothetical protein
MLCDIIIGDETWYFYYDPESKLLWKQLTYHDPRKLGCRNHRWRHCSSLPSISRVLFTFYSFHKAKQSTKLITWKYWSGYVKLCVEKIWTLVQRLDSLPWQCSSSQGALCQTVSGPKIVYWNWKPILFPWFGSEWLLAVSENKFCLKRNEHFRILKASKKKWRRHWKLFHNSSSKNVSNSGNIVELSA